MGVGHFTKAIAGCFCSVLLGMLGRRSLLPRPWCSSTSEGGTPCWDTRAEGLLQAGPEEVGLRPHKVHRALSLSLQNRGIRKCRGGERLQQCLGRTFFSSFSRAPISCSGLERKNKWRRWFDWSKWHAVPVLTSIYASEGG